MVFFFDAVGIFLLPKSTWYSALSSRQCSSLCNQNSLSVIMSPSTSSVKQAGAGLSPIYLHCAVLYCNSVHLIQSNFRAYYTVNSGMPQNFQAGGLSSNPSATHCCATLWPILVGFGRQNQQCWSSHILARYVNSIQVHLCLIWSCATTTMYGLIEHSGWCKAVHYCDDPCI